MKKYLIILIIVFGLCISLSIDESYATQIGFKIGGNASSFLQETPAGTEMADTSLLFGYQLGGSFVTQIFGNPGLSLDIGIDAMYATRGSKWEEKEYTYTDNNGAQVTVKQDELESSLKYLYIPFYLKINIVGLFYVSGGPYLNFLLSNDGTGWDKVEGSDPEYKDLDFGLTFRLGHNIGFEPLQIPIEIGFDYGLNDVNNNDKSDIELHNFTVFIQAGIYLGWS